MVRVEGLGRPPGPAQHASRGGEILRQHDPAPADATWSGALHGWIRRLPWAYLALLLYVAVALAANVLGYVTTLPLLDDAGYSDSYILHDARQYAQTGRLYRAPNEPPYNPSIYSPLFYLVLSLPLRGAEAANPFLTPRLIVGAAFLLCVLVSMSIAHRVFRHRSVVAWTGLLGLSGLLFVGWVEQLRTDFLGVLFGLLAVRLLMSRARWAPVAAGLAAGVAFSFKLTLIAAGLSGLLWLLGSRRVRDAMQFALGGLVTGAGIYLLFYWREPLLPAHLFALITSRKDLHGWLWVMVAVATEPIVLLAVSALPVVLRWPGAGRRLLVLYAGVSLLVGAWSALHPGANVNYLFETVFVAVPLAGAAAPRLLRLPGRALVPQLLLAALVAVFLVKPAVGLTVGALRNDVAARNAQIVALKAALRDRRVFAAVPQVAILTRTPPLTEPYLDRYLELLGRFDAGPLAARIRAGEFEVVVTLLGNDVYRGIEHLSPTFRSAIRSAYVPVCVAGKWLIHLPRGQGDTGPLAEDLRRLGCRPVRDVESARSIAW